jgi:Ca-activated chloride channel family protein
MSLALKRSKRLIILVLFILFCLAPDDTIGQSGRGGAQDSKKGKPEKVVPPVQPPKIRLPETQPQNPDDTIRINSDLVTVIATIARRSEDDRIDLKREDFEILEDGVPQEIANFARDVELPLKLIVLFDSSLSVSQKIEFERRAVGKFFERVIRGKDQAALFAFSSEIIVIQDFTNKIPLLVEATKQLKAEGATSLYDAIYLAADYLKPMQGRKVIVIVSDGSDTTSNKGLLEVLAQAQQADVVVFSVYTGNRGFSQNLRDLAGERALETLTSETGGEVFYPRATPGTAGEAIDEQSLKELDLVFAALADQLRTQFTLGFFSSNDKRDGSFRKLTVRIKKKGYVMRARKGYYAPKG